jgi:hypothetical protein
VISDLPAKLAVFAFAIARLDTSHPETASGLVSPSHFAAFRAGWSLFVSLVIHFRNSLFRSCSNLIRISSQNTLFWSLRAFSSSVIVWPEPPVLKLSPKVVAKVVAFWITEK